MDTGAPASVVAQSLTNALHCYEIRDISFFLGCESELERFKYTSVVVRALLLEAEKSNDRNDLIHEARCWLQDLKNATYNAEDVVDKFVTLAECINKKSYKESSFKVLEKVRHFSTLIKNLPAAFKISREIKRVRQDFDYIVRQRSQFGFDLDYEPNSRSSVETCSYVYERGIIGRKDDVERIVKMVLDPTKATQDVSCLSIVGIGGMGKTTLAQLVFNDERIDMHFPQRLWVSVGDQDPGHLNVQMVLSKIADSSSGARNNEHVIDTLRVKVGELLAKNKYLLVLDDLWNENLQDWHVLEELLKRGAPGSWVVVTTRSSATASIVGGFSHYLKGLSNEDSWRLFKMMAFDRPEAEGHTQDLVRIGKKIVKKCANIPLAIRAVATLLYGKGIEKWLSFDENVFAAGHDDDTLSILNLSYLQLDSPLKSCFSYCALFPNDFVIDLKMLIRLWIAQGYVAQAQEAQSIEDTALLYFMVLLHRCFFQVVKKDESGDIVSVKLEGLMHNLAQQVVKEEICRVDYFKSDLDKKVCHLSVAKGMSTEEEESWTKTNIRTLFLLYGQMEGLSLQILLKNCKSLRALHLKGSGIDILPDEIGKLLHLRYLDLSHNNFMFLPKSFTKLHNLETLNLSGCASLIKLPGDIWKLVKLRYLDIQGCKRMTHMPASIGKLSFLHTLTMFVVDLSRPDCCDLLGGVKSLGNIKGRFEIRIHGSENASVKEENISGVKCLINKKYIEEIVISFLRKDGGKEYQEKLMEVMQPNENLKRLELKWYKGENLPSWEIGDNLASSLPNLVEIQLYHCENVQYLPCMSQLRLLKRLIIDSFPNLEYVEKNQNRNARRVGATSEISETAVESCFFPRLEALVLQRLKKLKGWWREDNGEGNGVVGEYDRPLPCQVQHFPALLKLKVRKCPELNFLPSIPIAKEVELIEVNDMLRVAVDTNEREGGGPPLKMEVDNLRYLKGAMPLQRLTTLVVEFDDKVESLQEMSEVWWSCRSSLKDLKILSCGNLKSVGSKGLKYLTALQSLQISNCSALTFAEEGNTKIDNEEEGEHIEGGNHEAGSSSSSSFPFPQSLTSLDLSFLRRMEKLPEGMQNLTSLEYLSISYCNALVSLPEWIYHLNSRPRLQIRQCSVELQ